LLKWQDPIILYYEISIKYNENKKIIVITITSQIYPIAAKVDCFKLVLSVEVTNFNNSGTKSCHKPLGSSIAAKDDITYQINESV
jgi:hypothetical protein